ncbi:MAG: PAN domain-containing protein [Alphaproteobacteria bacterium]
MTIRPIRLAAGLALAIGVVACVPGGFGPGGGPGAALEYGVTRTGGDYANFDLAAANPMMCRAACQADAACQAWTYVNPGVQGPNARCWLKSSVPPPTTNACCVSGVK